MKAAPIYKIFAVIALGLLLIGCGNQSPGTQEGSLETKGARNWLQPEGKGEVLATVNGIDVYMEEFKERIEKQSPYIRTRYNSLEKKKEFLDNIIRFELLAQAAVERGYMNDPEVIRSAKQVMTQKLMREEFETKIKREDITEEDMKKYYDEHKSDYNKPAMRRASHILIKVPADAEAARWKKALEEAKKIVKEARANKGNPNHFRQLAAKKSQDESNKNRGGDLGYFARTEEGGPMVKEFSDTALKLEKINDISDPVKTKFGYHVIRLTGKRDKIERNFDQVKGQIQHRLYKEKRTRMFDEFVTKLKEAAEIEIDDKLLTDYQVPGAKPEIEKIDIKKQGEKAPPKAGGKAEKPGNK